MPPNPTAMSAEWFLCLTCQPPPPPPAPRHGDLWAGQQADVQDQVLPGQSGSRREGGGTQCWDQADYWPQAPVIRTLWEPSIRKEERRWCADIAGDAASAGGAWGLSSAFSSPFIALSKSDKPFGSLRLEEPGGAGVLGG